MMPIPLNATSFFTPTLYLSVMDYDVPISIKEGRDKIREEFVKHKSASDIRVIDRLVIKVSNPGSSTSSMILKEVPPAVSGHLPHPDICQFFLG